MERAQFRKYFRKLDVIVLTVINLDIKCTYPDHGNDELFGDLTKTNRTQKGLKELLKRLALKWLVRMDSSTERSWDQLFFRIAVCSVNDLRG